MTELNSNIKTQIQIITMTFTFLPMVASFQVGVPTKMYFS